MLSKKASTFFAGVLFSLSCTEDKSTILAAEAHLYFVKVFRFLRTAANTKAKILSTWPPERNKTSLQTSSNMAHKMVALEARLSLEGALAVRPCPLLQVNTKNSP